MRTRSWPNLATGTSTAVKLLVAGLTFTSVYVGVSAAYSAVHRPAEPVTLKAHTGARGATLARRRAAASHAGTAAKARQAGSAESDESGEVTVSSVTVRSAARRQGRCDRAFVARGVVRGGKGAAADGAVSYGWRLLRWSDASKRWRPYLTEQAGFAGPARAVEWHPHIVNNPGWYRVDLETASGVVHRSARFHVSC
jgi:hypothetical protein